MKIISFDLGANFGFATNYGPGLVGHWVLPGERQWRFLELANQLRLLFASLPDLEAVFYERPFARGVHATRSLWGMAGIIEVEAARAGLVALDMPPMTIKKFVTGKGNAPKLAMIAAAQRLGYTGSNEHEADAYCGLKYAEANFVKE